MAPGPAIISPSETTAKACPQCGNILPVDSRYVTWCDQCGWNLQPYILDPPTNIFEKLYARLGERLSKRLFANLSKSNALRPRLTVEKVLAFLIAACTHLATLLFALLALWLIVSGWPDILPVGVGIFCAVIAFLLRPRINRLDKEAEPLDPAQFPTLYRVAADVAQALKTSPPDVLLVDARFNASYTQVDLRQRKVVKLGLPLLSILDAQERVALLGHELGHGVNGDMNRGLFIGTALQSLGTWYEILCPDYIWEPDEMLASIANSFMWLLSRLPLGVLYLLVHLLWQDSQRAEYLADALAARVAGSDAELSSLDKLHFANTFEFALHRVSLSGSTRDVFEDFKSAAASVPARELERISRVEQLLHSRLDATHPPTPYRIAMLRAHPVAQPQVVLSPADFEQMERELATLRPKIQAELIDRHQAQLHY